MNSHIGEEDKDINSILGKRSHCKPYSISPTVSSYLEYIKEEPFYIPPTFHDVEAGEKISTSNPQFILISAPGATGKSSLAKYIAYTFGALYWDLSKIKLGTNSFVGSIVNAVGAAQYSSFISDLANGKALLVIDAFDEAEIISERRMIGTFIKDISDSVLQHCAPCSFLMARTETAQYIASFCANNSIPLVHYEIGFFQEATAKEFIKRKITKKGGQPTRADIECIDSYYSAVQNNITQAEQESFLGYAPVLEAISEHIKTSPNRAKMIQNLSSQTECVSIIMTIMEDLLDREQTKKVIPALKRRCMGQHPEFDGWDALYSKEEQLVRVVSYVQTEKISYNDYPIESLPPQMIEDYQNILNSSLPQHPFVRKAFEAGGKAGRLDFAGPAFREYVLAKIFLDKRYDLLGEMYFEDFQRQSYFPSQIFFDCYQKMSGGVIQSGHVAYVYDSFRAKATALERPYLQCSEILGEDGKGRHYIAEFGMMTGTHSSPDPNITMDLEVHNREIAFGQMTNIAIDTPDLMVKVGRSNQEARVSNSSVICREIKWETSTITIESFAPEGCLLVAKEKMSGRAPTFDIIGGDDLRVSAPNINEYYRLVPYKYDMEHATDFDIIQFIHAMRCIFVEFRTHKKDALAKSAERIDYVTVGKSKIKRSVLEYLQFAGIIYSCDHLYKINEAKMQEKGIFFEALSRMDTDSLNLVYTDFRQWRSTNRPES